jgi:hypothetical protein
MGAFEIALMLLPTTRTFDGAESRLSGNVRDHHLVAAAAEQLPPVAVPGIGLAPKVSMVRRWILRTIGCKKRYGKILAVSAPQTRVSGVLSDPCSHHPRADG